MITRADTFDLSSSLRLYRIPRLQNEKALMNIFDCVFEGCNGPAIPHLGLLRLPIQVGL